MRTPWASMHSFATTVQRLLLHRNAPHELVEQCPISKCALLEYNSLQTCIFKHFIHLEKKRGYGSILNINCVPIIAKIKLYHQDVKHMDLTLTVEHTSSVLVFINAPISSGESSFSDFK